MIKKIFLLLVLSLVSIVYARKDYTVFNDSTEDAESFRLEKPLKEVEAERSLAGDPIKKKKIKMDKEQESLNDLNQEKRSNSNVDYWDYSND